VHRFIALYPQPHDVAAFQEYYATIHVPLVDALPGIRNAKYSFDVAVLAGEASYACVFEAEFEDRAELYAAPQFSEGGKAAEDVANFATGGVILLDYAAA
jgi:uncharacterized protein (TIGR02118 family)